jgi:hypothetical protein
MAVTTRIDEKALAWILDDQHQVITRAQALRAGLTEHALRHRVRPGGPWQMLLPRVYIAVTGTPSAGQEHMAAMLYGGPNGIITGPAALPCHRIRAPQSEFVDVLVPITCQRRDAGHVHLHRTVRMPEQVRDFGGIRYALAARAVGDTVRGLRDLRDVRDVIADAVQRNKCELQDLIDELNAGPIRQSGLFREALGEVAGGIRSVAEGDLRVLLVKSGLSMPLFNAEVWAGDEFVARPDAWYPEFGIAIEVDSTEWHTSPKDHQQDVQRQTRMGKHLIVVLRFKPWEIRNEPAKVIAAIRNAIERARGRAPLNLRTIPAA